MPNPKWRKARERMRKEGLTEDEIDERESAQGDIEDHIKREER